MKTKAVLAALCGMVFTAHAWDAKENQIWLEGGVKGKITDTVSYILGEQVRYKEDGFDYFYRHTETCIQWNFASGWFIAPAFRYVTTTKKGITSSTPAWHLNLANTTAFLGMDFQTRARIYYSDPNGTQDQIDFRPKFCITPTKGWTSWKLKPFAADEIMINLDEGRFYLNRLSTGLMCSPVKKLSICSFIGQDLVENNAQADRNEHYNYGMQACFSFYCSGN